MQRKKRQGCGRQSGVFGILKRGGIVLFVYTDSYRSYNISDFHHARINHSNLFTKGKKFINGMENFWDQSKGVLRKYNGIDRKAFPF